VREVPNRSGPARPVTSATRPANLIWSAKESALKMLFPGPSRSATRPYWCRRRVLDGAADSASQDRGLQQRLGTGPVADQRRHLHRHPRCGRRRALQVILGELGVKYLSYGPTTHRPAEKSSRLHSSLAGIPVTTTTSPHRAAAR
jgi:hypothetical protein